MNGKITEQNEDRTQENKYVFKMLQKYFLLPSSNETELQNVSKIIEEKQVNSKDTTVFMPKRQLSIL